MKPGCWWSLEQLPVGTQAWRSCSILWYPWLKAQGSRHSLRQKNAWGLGQPLLHLLPILGLWDSDRVIIRPTDAIFFYSLGLLRTWWSQVGRLFTWELTSEKVQFGGSLLHFCFLKVRTRHIIPDPRTGKQDLSPRGGIGRVCGHLESRAAVSPPISVLQLVGGGSCREKGKLPFQHLQVPWNRWTKLKQERCADLLLHKHGQSLEHDFLAQHWLEAYMPFFL